MPLTEVGDAKILAKADGPQAGEKERPAGGRKNSFEP
jgi:hypothetical protein